MGTETFSKSGKFSSKSMGSSEGGDFVPKDAQEGYNRRGSKTSYPKSGLKGGMNQADIRSTKRKPFITGKSGGLQSESYPRKLHQNTFGTKGGASLEKPPTKTQTEA